MNFTMTIKEAREEILHTLAVYFEKNEWGQYVIPTEKQRPILLMGPPGIGKTAIMEQAAQEANVALVAYTITHHTRQSAVGLPVIREKKYGGDTFSVTEYTMSEIIASVYEKMEQSGLSEGILFLDEINCVSETLAPTMLQFLQYKTFGSHRLPEGWLIVAAGNPPAYNKSVRDFDTVTLDRLKRIDIEEDFTAWREYAMAHSIHTAILSYLDIKKQNFYQVDTTIDGEEFVTARGWEDLSRFMTLYEKKGIPVTAATVHQYLQHGEIARDFANYYELFRRYRTTYDVQKLLDGKEAPEEMARLKEAPFDEAVSLLRLFLGRLGELCLEVHERDMTISQIFEALQHWKGLLSTTNQSPEALLSDERSRMENAYNAARAAGQMTEERERTALLSIDLISGYLLSLADAPASTTAFDHVKSLFSQDLSVYERLADNTRNSLTNAFLFLEQVFAGRHEMVHFVTELTLNPHVSWFVSEHGCEKFYEYNRELLLDEKKTALRKKIRELS